MLRFSKPMPLIQWIAFILFIMLFGISGFMLIENYSFLDALYMVVITISTIGYHEVKPLSDEGRLFNIVLIILSFSTFTYALARLTQYIISGEMTSYFKNRHLMQALEKMQYHVIICGFGRNGQQAANILRAHKIDFVVIEKNPDVMKSILQDVTYLLEDATDDNTLIKAGVQRARSMITTLPEDANNVFIVLSARSLNPTLQIISRASNQSATTKLHKAGADNVIMPDMIGGTHMATLVSKPDVLEFINYLSGEDGESIYIESVVYDKLPAHLKNTSLKDIMNWKKTGVNCIGVKDEKGKFFINPPDTIIVSNGMKIMVLGTRNQIAEMKKNFEF
ncbi:potassium channel family protein [Segetibacter koreensis]|uniref:potassium channel family protein n=1 Tax=Segetibacter koreensis TaxID=398037 RepID=UPI0003A4A125|nr:potassium channel protein [Segetibacter koreensis]